MSNRNWGIILAAVVGLALYAFQVGVGVGQLTADPSEKAQGRQHGQAQAQVQNPRPQPTIVEANTASQYEKPCNQGDDQRSSDLCAQWKAADAASSAANATWLFGIIGAAIGFLTLTAAAAAAKFARDAAIHTETGAAEAKRAADESERSRLSYIERERGHLEYLYSEAFTQNDALRTYYHFKNIGASLAEIDGFSADVFDDPVWPTNISQPSTGLQKKVPPGEKESFLLVFPIPVKLPCYLVGFVTYRSLGQSGFRTHFIAEVRLSKSGSIDAYHLDDVWMPDDT